MRYQTFRERYGERIVAAFQQLLGELDAATVADLLAAVEPLALVRGQTLYRQGEPGDSLHIVLTGRLVVQIDHEQGPQVLAHTHPGECVGEMALLTGEPRAASVLAMRDSTLAVLRRPAFDQVIAQHPAAVTQLARMIVRRVSGARRADDRQRGDNRVIMLAPHTPQFDTRAFARRLQVALLRHGSVQRLDADAVRARFPHALPRASETMRVTSQAGLEQFLDDCEREHDFLLLEADGELTDWTLKCLGYADRVLLFTEHTALDSVSVMERHLRRNPALPVDLVLLHAAGSDPHDTRRWLEPRPSMRHFHLSWRGSEGFNRLARFLANRSISLVLAGGGARGFAHLGVIRALREAGVPIDAVGGTSFGALACTGLARAVEDEFFFEEMRHAFADERPLDDYTAPVVSLVRGERLDQILQERLNIAIEDLWLPFFAVSTNLSRNQIMVHDRGPLWRAIRASVSLPGVLPPVVWEQDLLIDGGVLNNLPVDVMRDRMPGRVIAVNLAVEQEYRLRSNHVPSAVAYLRSRLLPWSEPLEAPTLAKVILKTTTLASRKETEAARRLADLYLNPALGGFDLLDWGKLHDIVEVGYHSAKPAIAEWVSKCPEVILRESVLDA